MCLRHHRHSNLEDMLVTWSCFQTLHTSRLLYLASLKHRLRPKGCCQFFLVKGWIGAAAFITKHRWEVTPPHPRTWRRWTKKPFNHHPWAVDNIFMLFGWMNAGEIQQQTEDWKTTNLSPLHWLNLVRRKNGWIAVDKPSHSWIPIVEDFRKIYEAQDPEETD